MADTTIEIFTEDMSTDVNFMCSICHNKFTDPYCTQCDHIFCRQCITQSTSATCPTCGADISQRNFQPANRVLTNLIDGERVVCNRCGQSGIVKANIGDHLQSACAKSITTCPAADIQCSWTGTRDTLDEHLLVCGLHSVHSLIIQLKNENQQLKRQMNTFQDHCMEQNQQRNRDIQLMTDNQSISNCQFQEQIFEEERKLTEQQNSLIDLNCQIQKLKSDVDVLRTQLVHCSQEKDLITKAHGEQQTRIEHLTRKLNVMAGLIGYHNTALIERITQCDQRMMQMNDKKLNDEDMFIVVQQTMINKPCEVLDLQSHDITEKGIRILADALEMNQVLKILLLFRNRLLDVGISHLAKALMNNTTLETLELESTGITDTGAGHLAEMLRKNSKLNSLYLSDNQISFVGIRNLVETLADHNRTLAELVLDQNRLIDDRSLISLTTLLEKNQTLITLRLHNCDLSEQAKTILREKAQSKNGFTLML